MSLLTNYLQTIENERTRRNTKSRILKLEDYAGKSVEDLLDTEMYQYFAYLEQQVRDRKLSRKTYAAHISSVKGYCRYLELAVEGYESPAEKVKAVPVDGSIDILRTPSLSECDDLLADLEEGSDEYLFFAFAIFWGASIRMMCEMDVENFFDRDGKWFYQDKSQQNRIIRVPSDLETLVINRISQRKTGPIFLTKRGSRYTQRTMEHRVATTLASRGLNYTLGDFRNRGIMELLASGTPPQQVADYMDLSVKQIDRFKRAVRQTEDFDPGKMRRIQIMTNKKIGE